MKAFNSIMLILSPFMPLFFAAMGGILSERVGIINIALEGFLIISAFVAGVVYFYTSSIILAILAGCASSGLAGLLHYFLTVKLRLNHIVSGLGINIFASGITVYITSMLFDQSRSFQVGVKGSVLPVFLLIAAFVLITISLFFNKTPIGLRYKAVGENPFDAKVLGIRVNNYRAIGLFASGFITGIGGAFLVLQSGSFVKDIAAGRGYIALAAVIFGNWKPLPAALGALIFAGFDWLGTSLQGRFLPDQILRMLPYIITIIALAGIFKKASPPAALGRI
ncbi:ABC transporter permease [bacterium]|nr:ABC transporter permease [bacterium]